MSVNVMMVQTKCKLNNTELFLKLFHIQSKLETTSTTKKQQKLKNGKVRFRLNRRYRKEMEDSMLNAIKQLITFVKGRLNFSCKSTTAAKGGGKRGNIVAETLLLMRFPCARNLGNICCGHKMFLNKIRNIFCVPNKKFVSATNVARMLRGQTGKHLCRQQCAVVCLGLKGRHTRWDQSHRVNCLKIYVAGTNFSPCD